MTTLCQQEVREATFFLVVTYAKQKTLIHHLKYGLFLLLWVPMTAFSQNPYSNPFTDSLRFERLGVEHGLPDPRINSIIQDTEGFFWIGTANGLSRYDGTEFRNFFKQNDQHSLAGNFITKLINYDSSHILVGTTTGLSLLNTHTMEFTNFLVKSAPVMFSRDNYYTALAIDSLHRIWAGTRTALYCLDNNLQVLKTFRGYTEKVYNYVRMTYVHSITVLPENDLLVSLEQPQKNNSYYFIYSNTTDSLHLLEDLPQHTAYPLEWLGQSYLGIDNNGKIYSINTSYDTLSFYDPEKKQLLHSHFLFSNPAQNLHEKHVRIMNAGNNIIACLFSRNGFFLWPSIADYKRTGTLTMPLLMKDKNVFDIKLDKEGNFWVGADDGLYKQISTSKKIQSQLVTQENPSEWNFFRLSFIGNEIWAGSENAGVFRVNKDSLHQKQILFRRPGESRTVWGVVQPQPGDTLWVSTQMGMRWYDQASDAYGWLPLIPGKPGSMENLPVTALYTDSKGLIWMGIGFGNGVAYYDPGKNTFTHFPSKEGNNPLPIRYPMSIAEDRDGNLWMGNEDGAGLVCWNRQTNRFKLITPDYFATFNTAAIPHLWCNRKEDLWIATHDGLFRYHIPSQKFFRFDRSTGLPANYVNAITEDSKGRIWAGTTNGLSCLFPKENRVVNFMHPQILPEAAIQDISYDAATGKVFFITNHYINAFDPEELLQQSTPLYFRITGISIGNQERAPGYSYVIPFNDNDININYTAINFADGQLNNYYYRLAGKEWIAVGHQRQINFLNLSPGEYSISLKAVNSAGIWSNEVTLLFTIRQPWFKSWWFLSIIIAAVASIITVLIKRRIRNIRHEAEMKQRIAETEMQALRAQMNPHFIFNCINSIDALIQSNDKYHATMYLNKFARLIRNILDSSRQNRVPLTKDLETLQLYIDLEQFRSENTFTAEIKADEILLQDDYKVPPLIVQPYVENAILHGLRHRPDHKGKLSISVIRQQDHIEYVIEDNGVGRAADKRDNYTQNRSYGMTMSSNRVKLFNDEEKPSVEIIDITDQGKPAGTRVRVLLKIQ